MRGALFEMRPAAYRFNTQRGTWPASASMMSVNELRTHTRLSLIADVRCVRSEGRGGGERSATAARGMGMEGGARYGRREGGGVVRDMGGGRLWRAAAAAHLHEVGQSLPRVG